MDERLPQLLMCRELDIVPLDPYVPCDIDVRPATTDDEPVIAGVLTDAFNDAWSVDRVARELTRRSDVDTVFVAEADGMIIGTASARLGTHLIPGAGYVHWVATAGGYRGRGVARALCAAVLRRFQELGCRSVVLETDDARTEAVRLYWRLGFRPLSRHPMDGTRWDAVLAACDLCDREE